MPDPAKGPVQGGSGCPGPVGPGQRCSHDDDGAAPPAVVVPFLRRANWKAGATAGGAGVLAAILGTALHLHTWLVGGLVIPVGALAAVVLLTSAAVFAGLFTRSVPAAALTGVVTYVLVGLAATFGAGSLIAAGAEVEGAAPPVAVAGSFWVVGVAVGTVVAVAFTWRVLQRSSAVRASVEAAAPALQPPHLRGERRRPPAARRRCRCSRSDR